MTMPTSFDGAVAMLGELVRDDNLILGMQTVGIVLLFAGVLTWALLRIAR